jgi:hypothetical protein
MPGMMTRLDVLSDAGMLTASDAREVLSELSTLVDGHYHEPSLVDGHYHEPSSDMQV